MTSLKSMEDMIGFYLESLYREELRKASGNEAEQLLQEEQAAVYSAMRMELNMGICNHRLQGQRKILEQAGTQGVLNGEPAQLQNLYP